MEPKNLSECSVTELKAFVYDEIVIQEQSKRRADVLNQEIASRNDNHGKIPGALTSTSGSLENVTSTEDEPTA